MNTFFSISRLFGFILFTFLNIGSGISQTFTEYQIIHNSPDPYLDTVDAWEGYSSPYILQENFAFRTALPAVSIPSGPALQEHLSPADNYPPIAFNIIKTSTAYQRIANESYIIFYVGLYESGFSSSAPLDIVFYERPIDNIPEDSVSFTFVNGSTDLGKIDIQVPEVGNVVDNAPFAPKPVDAFPLKLKSFKLDTGMHTFIVTDTTGTQQIKAFIGDLSDFGGQSLTLFTSGFLYPELNKSGASLGLFAALKSGRVIEFPSVITSTMEANKYSSLLVFPTPAKDEIRIKNNFGTGEKIDIYISTVTGINVLNEEEKIFKGDEIILKTDDLAEGTYLIKMTNQGKASMVKFNVIK